MHLAIGEQDRASHPFRRHIGQCLADRRERLRSVVVARRAGNDLGFAHLQILFAAQCFANLRRRARRIPRPRVHPHALRFVDDQRHHIRKRFARLMHDQRIGQRQQHHNECEPARPGAPRPLQEGIQRHQQRRAAKAPQQPQRHMRREIYRVAHCPSRSRRAGTCT